MSQKIVFTNDIAATLDTIVDEASPNRVFVITDVNVDYFVLSRLSDCKTVAGATRIVIKSGDINKNVDSLSQVWKQLCDGGASRKSLIINIGGGVVTDLGGFAAATFKRGVRFVNVPTTLLSAVDAAVGGKTGINFNGFKNEVGAFCEADAVIISTRFLDSLPIQEVKSGYAEMLKHGLLSSRDEVVKLLAFDFSHIDHELLLSLLTESVEVKRRIVAEDPHEQGIRRALNLGHTVGHAFESLALKRMSAIPHGYAVAWGTVVELVLSHMQMQFDSVLLNAVADFVRTNYGAFAITCNDYDAIIDLMHHDKKSHNGELNFSLLSAPGYIHIDSICDAETVKAALDIYRDLMHI